MQPYAVFITALVPALLFVIGCSGDPPLHPISGKVTLGGQPHERLLVYFRPINEPVTQFNLGVGETDKDGNLKLRSSGGMGLEAGQYRVTFSCFVVGNSALGVDQKVDELSPGSEDAESKQMVPKPYLEQEGTETSPVEFTIKPGQNVFEFDIPLTPAG